MRPGHIFTIEPMINLGASQDKTWPDNWTAVTADGMRSAQVSSSKSTYTNMLLLSCYCCHGNVVTSMQRFCSVVGSRCSCTRLMLAVRERL
jgi:methionine aminopeptidase